MSNKIQSIIQDFFDNFSFRSSDNWVLFVIAFLGLAGISDVISIKKINNLIVAKEWGGAIFIILLYFILFRFLMQMLPKRAKKEMKKTVKFDPFLFCKRIAENDQYKQKDNHILSDNKCEKKELLNKLECDDIIVVKGESGAGKTTFINSIISSENKKYEFLDKNSEEIESISSQNKKVYIYDQFEDILERAITDNSLNEISEEINNRLINNQAIVILIQNEKYYLLEVLKKVNKIPHLFNSITLKKVDKDSDAVTKVYKKINELCWKNKNKKHKEQIAFFNKAVSLFELHCFGALLELYFHNNKNIDFVLNLDPGMVIKELIREYVDYSTDRGICMRVLYIIKQRQESGLKTTKNDIISILNTYNTFNGIQIEKIINDLKNLGLIRGPFLSDDTFTLFLAHDAMIHPVELLSSDILDSADRDYIRYCIEMSTRQDIEQDEEMKENNLSVYVYISIVFLMCIRLFVPIDQIDGLSWSWYAANSDFQFKENQASILNNSYLFIAIPHFLWCSYILKHYEKIYVYSDVGNRQKYFSRFLILNLIICVFIGCIWPAYWIFAIGWGGLIQNIKIHLLSKTENLTNFAKDFLKARAIQTYFNMALTFLLGWIFIKYVDKTQWNVYYFLVFLYVYFAYVLHKDHVSDQKTIFIISLIKRKIS